MIGENEYAIVFKLKTDPIIVEAADAEHAIEKAKERLDKGDFSIADMEADSVEKIGHAYPERESWEDR